jgi:hypothetical protein
MHLPIQALRIPGLRHDRIRANEPPQPLLPALPGEAAIGGQRAAKVRRRGGSILRLVSGSKFQVAGHRSQRIQQHQQFQSWLYPIVHIA